ncbi:uncharacterized protein LOC125500196 [Athalia rosae]|uniref:uncharacterized protein LOC125500196 n=1 Tax=Athalia rosae TaxID=37344 RepID=UPI0020341545|nr:uncharacterized protein LOC125500196 [Athalia rosae]
MDFIVDIQGFRDVHGRFLPKEVASVALEHPFSSHWLVQPPYPFTDLSGKERAVNNYVTCYHHGIDWFVGDITLHQLATNSREITRNAHRFITRGVSPETVTKRTRKIIRHHGLSPETLPCQWYPSISLTHQIHPNPQWTTEHPAVLPLYQSTENLDALPALQSETREVSAADQIPLVWTAPTIIVANTDDHTRGGSHWVAFYVSPTGHGLYFDSFGIPPLIPHHRRTLRRNCRRLHWNVEQLQSLSSDVCGQYCIMFVHLMAIGFTLAQFVDIFDNDHENNDRIVAEFYEGLTSTDHCNNKSRVRTPHCIQCCEAKKLSKDDRR